MKSGSLREAVAGCSRAGVLRHWSGQAVGRQPPAAQTLGGQGGVGSSLVFPVSADCIATGTEVRIDRVDTTLQSCHIRANTAF